MQESTRNCKKLKVSEQQMKQLVKRKDSLQDGRKSYQYTYDSELVPRMHKELQNAPKEQRTKQSN